MIDVKDLRIGNFILTGDGWSEIDSIIKSGKDFLLHFTIHSAAMVANVNVCEGVQLTPDILEKCGFEITDHLLEPVALHYSLKLPVKGTNENEINFIIMQISGEESFGNAIVNGHWASNNFKHLHQLQNLYFALTGEELKVNL